MRIVEVTSRKGPLVLSMPHCGQGLPDHIGARLNDTGRAIGDTDWWIDRLYNFADELHATTVTAQLSRYVIDLNRDPSGVSLYPGQATTGLCPTATFDNDPLYLPGMEPDSAEIEERRKSYFDPYHEALAEALAHTVRDHGFALLYDCHSIRSHVPRLFEGELPTINIGTNGGASCSPLVEHAIDAAAAQGPYPHVLNARFKGGWITRHYGNPSRGIHAVQVELAQSAYMQETPPWTFLEDKAENLRATLHLMLRAMTGWSREDLGPGS